MAGVMHDNLTGCRMANLKKYLNIHDHLQIQVPSELTLFLIHHQRKVIGALRVRLGLAWGGSLLVHLGSEAHAHRGESRPDSLSHAPHWYLPW
jgi:hypothetical protein